MSSITQLIAYEEGWRSKPYYCSEGYPTIGFGFRVGPQSAPLNQYQFTLPRVAGEAWLQAYLEMLKDSMEGYSDIQAALAQCNEARASVLYSMAYQMGVSGLAQFKKALHAIQRNHWFDAKNEMLDSRWARQTPNRAQRHADQIQSGLWFSGYSDTV